MNMKIIGLFLVIIMILPVFTFLVSPDEKIINNDEINDETNYSVKSIQNKLYNLNNTSIRLTSIIVEFNNNNSTLITETNGENKITPYFDDNLTKNDYKLYTYRLNQTNKTQWILLTGNNTFVNQSNNNSFKEDILIEP